MGKNNLSGTISIRDIRLIINNMLIDRNGDVAILTKALSDPSTDNFEIKNLRYSVDGGKSFHSMTSTRIEIDDNAIVDHQGTPIRVYWDAKKDVGTNLYDKVITVSMNAYGSGIQGPTTTLSKVFTKDTIDNQGLGDTPELPKYYKGMSGSAYLSSKLPRTK